MNIQCPSYDASISHLDHVMLLLFRCLLCKISGSKLSSFSFMYFGHIFKSLVCDIINFSPQGLLPSP